MFSISEKFYITTAIAYPNSKPHIGHAYEFLLADVIARWHKLLGKEVFFLTGTDEHGQKIQNAAKEKGKQPQEFLDEMVVHFTDLCKKWDIDYSRFIRTTEPDHEEVSRKIFKKVFDQGDIYLGEYEGLYCTGCERFYTEKDLQGDCCPIHKKPVEKIKEESYFFKMSKYEKQLLELFEKNKEFIYPLTRRQEIINRVKEGLNDLSVSRTTFDWGIKVPGNEKHVIYVWFDALLNYVSGVDYPGKNFKKFWPADQQHIGKDILWFHSVIWPCILFAAGIDPPKKICVHGFINSASGEKMSKSLGNVVDPIGILDRYEIDMVRYFLLREIPYSQDGNFSEDALIERANSELANDLGNLLNRAMAMTARYCNSVLPKGSPDNELVKELNLKKIEDHMQKLETNMALAEIWKLIGATNKYINDTEPWVLAKNNQKELDNVLYNIYDSLRISSILLLPFIPETAGRIQSQLNCTGSKIEECKFGLSKPGTVLGKKEILFKKIEKIEKPKKTVKVEVEKAVSDKGIKVVSAIVRNCSISNRNKKLEEKKKEIAEKVKQIDLESNPIINEYKSLQNDANVFDRKSPAVHLTEIIKNSGSFPRINTAVDSYNVVSVETFVSVGAHDLEKVKGNVRFVAGKGNEKFIPMGKKEQEKINPREYLCMDDEEVLCRMDIKQCDSTKISKQTKDLLIYVQGNKKTTKEYLENALKSIVGNLQEYCKGEPEFL